jgi:hypothetical protein
VDSDKWTDIVSIQVMKKTIKAIVGVLIVVFVLILILLLSPVIIPVGAFMYVREAISLKIFRHREDGHFYLICASKRNWQNFLRNNVIPVLPCNIKVVWCKPREKGAYSDLQQYLSQSKICGISKPYIVAVTKHAIRVKSLNGDLQKQKANEKISEETRIACLKIVEECQKGLLITPSANGVVAQS